MKNREIRNTQQLRDINAFHFVCPEEREQEAREVLGGIAGIIVYPETKPVNHPIFGTNRRLVGKMVGGICYPWMTDTLRTELSSRQIADIDVDTEVRILQQGEMRNVHGTVTGYRKWLRRV